MSDLEGEIKEVAAAASSGIHVDEGGGGEGVEAEHSLAGSPRGKEVGGKGGGPEKEHKPASPQSSGGRSGREGDGLAPPVKFPGCGERRKGGREESFAAQ
jgi:hypothetical protein